MPSSKKSPKFKTFLTPSEKGGMFHYPHMDIPFEIADALLGESNQVRVIMYLENGVKLHRALKRTKNGETRISLGKSTLKQAKINPDLEVSLYLEIDETEFGYEMPEELMELMRQDPEGDKAFRELKPGLQRSFLHYIVSAKTVDTRIKRSLKLIDNLKQGIISAGTHRQG
ncbi:YdeI/OmpD-associated family protein [Owenweeksia hongkongensis]|uniref:YdeI/OmpD-associated family protein n=1 Tax=Owenweeksia hongkongensis TaxID=253245 RepID=UPI003A95172D